MNKANQEYFENFFAEKVIPYKVFEIEHEGDIHIIDNETIIDIIKNLESDKEASQIRNILVKLDFENRDINHFLEHLAKGHIANNY